jgi:hypothetical protein
MGLHPALLHFPAVPGCGDLPDLTLCLHRRHIKTPASLVAALSRILLRSVFNPYADRCPQHDRHDAARIRRRNLIRYLEGALDVGVDTMWIARDLGYRSGRRTGIPITDERRLGRPRP